MEEAQNETVPSKRGNGLAIAATVGVVLLLGFVVLRRNSSSQSAPVIPETFPAVNGAATDTSAAPPTVRQVSIEAGSFYYKPNEIRIKKGETIRLTLTSMDMMHDFNVDALNIHLPVTKSGTSSSAEFAATQTGTFEYYCSVGQHRQRGQVGTLIVTE